MKADILEQEAQQAAESIKKGGIILYPTDTIWGIGCDATNEDAVQRIYGLKKRSDSKSMLVLMADPKMLQKYLGTFPKTVDPVLQNTVKPTTIIYPGARNFAPGLVAEDGSVGIRLSSDAFCKRLIEICRLPIVSTSANFSGQAPASLFSEISPGILKGVDHVVKWRQDDKQASAPSSIIKIEIDGSLTVIRE